MGLATIERVMAQFIAHGASSELPVAVIDNGTRKRQRVVTGTLADIAEKTAAAGLKGPTIIIIGTVVTLRGRLAWFEPNVEHSPLPGGEGGDAVAG
jgi:uroporphyrin-III C-methyltransferase/precorrin-2 dehydrogenase/sirohydrochlorin ferrochelatase